MPVPEKELAVYLNWRQLRQIQKKHDAEFFAKKDDLIAKLAAAVKEDDLPEINKNHQHKIEDVEVRIDEATSDLTLFITKMTLSGNNTILYADEQKELYREYGPDFKELGMKYHFNLFLIEIEQFKKSD